jgi:5-methyltetrahydropteroyltriglutamate--homocysteine methyltransferase
MSKLIKIKEIQIPFRYDIVGSFLRPENLKEARAKYEKGNITKEELKAIEDEEIKKLVNKQKQVGLKAVTDGEFRRSWWHLDFFWGFDGVERTSIAEGYHFHGETSRAETASLSGKVTFGNHPFLSGYQYLYEIAGDDVVARQTIPAPAQLLFELDRVENIESTKHIYPEREELISDIAKAYQEAIQAFYTLGCRNIQIDDCTWGALCDENFRNLVGSNGANISSILKEFAHLNNEAIKYAPADLIITTHVCRGNFHSTWAASGGYDPVASELFQEDVSAFYLEYDTERAGDFTPLKLLPTGKKVVLGLVSSKTGELEKREVIINRIKEASQYVSLENLYLSPQCGFASTEEGNILTEDEQWAKIELVKSIAEEVWNE